MIGALQARLADSLARAQEADDSLAVLNVALGRPITGTPSWADGELTTLLVGALRGAVRVTDSVLCTDPHEAWILLPGCDFDGAAGVADRVAAALEDLDAAVGIAIFPDHSAQPSWLARHAELASARARNAASAFAFADPQENDPPGASIIHELPAALREHRLVAHYQPQIDLSTRRMVGVEALARWDHPERGLLEPAAFLPLAQMTRLGVDVDLEMLRTVARQVAAWGRAGHRLPVAVKICGRTLMTPGFFAELRGIMRRAGSDAGLVKIEVQEEAVTSEPRAAAVIDELRQAGVRVCIERFGSGASSLTAIERLQVDELKLDPDLVHLARDNKHVGALASLVAGGHALGVKVSAANLDSEQVVRATWGLGCDFGQGFALGRPVPVAELPEVGAVENVPAAISAIADEPAAKVLRLPQLRRPSLPRPRIAASGALMRLGSAAALVAAGLLAGSVPLGTTTLGAAVAGAVTAPATAILASHPAAPATNARGTSTQNGARSQTGSGSTSSNSSGGHSATSTSSTGTNGTSSTGTGSSSSSTVPLPLPSVQLPTPLPTPKLPLPSPSQLP